MVSSTTETGNGGERWRELLGDVKSWDGLLLDPLHPDLRKSAKSLVSYGELVSATGYGFNSEKRLPHNGLCMYGPDDLLAKSGVADARYYRVTKLVYATAERLLGTYKQTTFKDAFDSFDHLKALHVKNKIDPVPMFMDWLPDLDVTLLIDTSLSPYLKDPNNTAHELECYLHGVAGVQGSAAAAGGGGFDLVVDRDVALLNRSADALKDEYPVPASWWMAENKSMVKNAKGKWELKDYEQIY